MHEIKLPQLGQSVEEASIVTWYKNPGDEVAEGEPLFSVQTDKAEIECEATASGVLREILVEPDDVVPVLTVVALVGARDEPLPDLAQYKKAVTAAATPTAVRPEPARTHAPAKRPAEPAPAAAYPAASPRATATAARLGVALVNLTGTGPNGRIIEADVIEAARDGKTAKPARDLPAPDLSQGTLRKLTPMRQTVAKRMTDSKFAAPHYYATVEVDMTACKAYRETVSEFRPTYNDLILAAIVRALREYPTVNAQWTDNGVLEFNQIHLGFAVALPEGLIVPVIRNAGEMALAELHDAAQALVEKARENRLTPDEYSGATFTVSNLGPYGVGAFTAIINPPGSAIIAVGEMRDRPVVRRGAVAIAPTMNMTLSSDHRVIDGALAATFIGSIKNALEQAGFSA